MSDLVAAFIGMSIGVCVFLAVRAVAKLLINLYFEENK